jgi:hypothetical protein
VTEPIPVTITKQIATPILVPTLRVHCFTCAADVEVQRGRPGYRQFNPRCPRCGVPFELICQNQGCGKRYVPKLWKFGLGGTLLNQACSKGCMKELHNLARRQKNTPKMIRCEFQGGVDLPAEFHPPADNPCLGEFVATTCKKYCDNCQEFAYAADNLGYRQRNRKKLANKSRREAKARAKAAGRPHFRLGAMVRCQFRDDQGNRCRRKFKRKAWNHIHCEICKPLVKARNHRNSAEKHAAKITEKASEKWQEMKKLKQQHDAGVLVQVDANAARPKALRPAKVRGRKTRPSKDREYFRIATLVEENVASGMELTKARHRVVQDENAARRRAGTKKLITYKTVALYHREFLRLPAHPPV